MGSRSGGHLRNYVSGKVEVMRPFRKFIYQYSVYIGIACAAIFLLSGFFIADSIEQSYIKGYWDALKPLLGSHVSADNKLDVLIKINAQGGVQRYERSSTIFMIIVWIIALALMIYVEKQADHRKPSFIILTDAAKQNAIVAMRRYNGAFRNFWLGIAVGILINILSSVVYDAYVKEKVLGPVMKLLDLNKDSLKQKPA